MSQDGRNWARIESEHHTGALFDVGEAGEWDELFIGTPQVWLGFKELAMALDLWLPALKADMLTLSIRQAEA